MEVHHHSHHSANKSWKTYLWEFFMLFLAVFCGFLAEYKLEHVIEHQREEKYIHSLIKDLELNIKSMKDSHWFRERQISYFDSLTTLLKGGYQYKMNDFYFYTRHITRSTNFEYQDRTIQQLKNSGNFRLIRNNNAADSITIFDNVRIKSLLTQQENEAALREYISQQLVGKVVNAFIWDEMVDRSNGQITRPTSNPPLITSDTLIIRVVPKTR
jgi:hypothetical protein